jgi:DNA-binding MarR family transcriptional regulator
MDTVETGRGKDRKAMKLAKILGYQLDMARCAALRALHQRLADTALKPADTTALLLVWERPGCDQTTLGRALAGNRSAGMKVASRLESRGLLMRGEGRDRRSKGLYVTEKGERTLADLMRRHRCAEAVISTYLTPAESDQLLLLLAKVQQGVIDDEAKLVRVPSVSSAIAAAHF